MSQHRTPDYWTDAPVIERIYPLMEAVGFEAVDTALCNLVDRKSRGNFTRRVVKDGLVVYEPLLIGLFASRIAVLSISPLVATVQFEFVGVWQPLDPNTPIPHEIILVGAGLLQQVDQAVVRVLRAGFHVSNCKPPMPPREDIISVFEWQYIYYPNMSNEDLSELLVMKPQSVANARTRFCHSRELYYERLSSDELQERYPVATVMGKIKETHARRKRH